MIDQDNRVRSVVKDELGKIALGDKHAVGFAVVVGVFAPVPDPSTGQMGIGPATAITVTVRSPLLGQPDIAITIPVPSAAPPDQLVRMAVAKCLESARAERDKQSSITPQGETMSLKDRPKA